VLFENIHNNFGQIIRTPSFNDLFLKNQYKQVVPTLNKITMEWNPQLVISCDNFITRKDKILWTCNNLPCLLKHLVVLALNHYSTNRIIPMILRFMRTLKKENNGFIVLISNIGLPYYNKICKIVTNCCLFFPFSPFKLTWITCFAMHIWFVENMSPHSWHVHISCSHKIPFPSCPNVQYVELF